MTTVLNWISNFIQEIGSILKSLFMFVMSMINGLFNLIKLLPTVLSFSTSAIGFLPSFLAAFASVTIAIAIIYLILGRNSGKGGE